jgi:4-amino-4-deoxy-L-arabinose transferase-like glycosyltransferase
VTPSSRWRTPRAFGARLALIALGALALRVVYALTIGPDENAHIPAGDRFFFVEGARLLAGGHGFIHPFVWEVGHQAGPSAAHPPLWMTLLAPLAKLGALSDDSARVAGAFAGAGAVVVIGLVGRRVAGPRAGLIAAGIAAAYPAWIVGDTSGMSEALYLLLVAAAVLALLAAREAPSWRSAALVGLAVGLAALTRTEGLLLLPFAVWPLLWRRWGPLAAATLVAALVIAPWTIRNAVALDRLVPVSTNASAVLAGANCPEAYRGPAMGSWVPACVDRASGEVSLGAFREGVLADRWRSGGLTYARRHAGRLVVVAPVRVLRTWRLWQPLREGEQTEGQNRTAAKIGALSFLLLLLPAGLLGAWRAPLRRDQRLLFAGLALMVSVTSAAGWGAPRFLRPAELALIVCAAAYVAVSSGSRPSRPT